MLMAKVRSVMEDRLLTLPNPLFTPAFKPAEISEVECAVRQMEETACADVGPRVSVADCAAVSRAVDRALAGERPEIRTWSNQRTGIQLIRNPLRLHSAIIAAATSPFLLAIVERYLRRRVFLADIDMRRVPPMAMEELDQRAGTKAVGYTSSHWHRDVRGRQVKIMIYFTDVGEQDNNFAYLPGTHRGHQTRPFAVEKSRLTEAEVAALGVTPVECYGPAGKALVFDTNAIHRLRRKAGSTVRDTVTFYYTPGQELRALDFDPAALAGLTPAQRAIFSGERVAMPEEP